MDGEASAVRGAPRTGHRPLPIGWHLPPKLSVTSGRFTMAGTPTSQEGKRRCMADVATAAADTFTLRLTAVMLVTETKQSR